MRDASPCGTEHTAPQGDFLCPSIHIGIKTENKNA